MPEPGRSNHIYSAYEPCVGDPVYVRRDTFGELFPAPNWLERELWPADFARGVVIGFRRVEHLVGVAVTAVLETGQTIELVDSNFFLDVDRIP